MDLSDENILGFSKRDLCTAIAILPAELLSMDLKIARIFIHSLKNKSKLGLRALFTCSSLHSNHVYAEACFRTLGKKNCCDTTWILRRIQYTSP